MKLKLYIPQIVTIPDSEIPSLNERARRRHGLPSGRTIPVRHLVEEARLAGLIELGSDYCIDVEFEEEVPARERGRRKSSAKSIKSHGGRDASHHGHPRA